MIGTEKEFASKRCTLALVLLTMPKDERDNLASGSDWQSTGKNCIGSRCAQWCWYDYANADGKTYFGSESMAKDFGKGRASPAGVAGGNVERPARGYCGLTGTR